MRVVELVETGEVGERRATRDHVGEADRSICFQEPETERTAIRTLVGLKGDTFRPG